MRVAPQSTHRRRRWRRGRAGSGQAGWPVCASAAAEQASKLYSIGVASCVGGPARLPFAKEEEDSAAADGRRRPLLSLCFSVWSSMTRKNGYGLH